MLEFERKHRDLISYVLSIKNTETDDVKVRHRVYGTYQSLSCIRSSRIPLTIIDTCHHPQPYMISILGPMNILNVT